MDTPEGLRLRLMSLLSLYELLPYSISNPPNGTAPVRLEEAIGAEAVRRCLEAMYRQSPTLKADLENIVKNFARNASASSGNTRPGSYSSYPGSSSQGNYHGSS
ncbi:hypothetical protein M413DRAFT_25422 [Hebeloma cylindrosporum]|uniref:Uncharacterized protein n=1 Tax=Hebeloma cylindrosporum TaxID=76867 RepID=A0A0C3CID8_HEBCY|nr:hypothetical protein M413DRAFT_25422 [Hebeloma cylindrosporum h7]